MSRNSTDLDIQLTRQSLFPIAPANRLDFLQSKLKLGERSGY
jgi:hypothetical protein